MKSKSQHVQSLPDLQFIQSPVTSANQSRLAHILNSNSISWQTDLQEKYSRNYEIVLNYDEIEA
jgi:hypothetical protein